MRKLGVNILPSLAVKYRPATFSDLTEQSTTCEILENITNADPIPVRNFLFVGPAGCGKAQPMYSKILTPSGWITMRDVKIGTLVYTGRGNVAKVSGIYFQCVRPIYEIQLEDDSKIRVADNHLNVVISDRYQTEEVITTLDVLNRIELGEVFTIPNAVISELSDSVNHFGTGRQIVSVNYIENDACQCIMIDHPDHTYVSDDYILTHNTTLGRALAHKLNHNDSNIIEVDAASNNGVDSVRQLISQMQTYPVGSKYKIFILDECHAFSQAAWQTFLKILEDVPANTINVFCTTNPEKIPATILSRVQTFQLSKISLTGITNRLKYVLDSEISEGRNIKYDMDAIGYIAKLANGGMRDALTLLDKALTYSNDISLENISKSLNIPNYDDYFDLLNACAKKDNVKITQIVNNVYNSGVNFVSWFTGFHSFIVNIMKYIFLQDIKETMIPAYYEDKISHYNIKHSAVCLKLANKVLKLNNELKTAVYLQETALTYLCS